MSTLSPNILEAARPIHFHPAETAQTPEDLTITPTGDPVGAIVSGLDASKPLAPYTVLKLKQAFAKHKILIFKDQSLTDEQYLNFATYFGPVF